MHTSTRADQPSVRSMADIGHLFNKSSTEHTMTTAAQQPTATPGSPAAAPQSDIERMVTAAMERAFGGLQQTFTQEMSGVSEKLSNISTEMAQNREIIEAAKAAAEKVDAFAERVGTTEQDLAALKDRLDAANVPTPADASKESLFKRYGLFAGQAAMMVTTIGVMIYGARAGTTAPAGEVAAEQSAS